MNRTRRENVRKTIGVNIDGKQRTVGILRESCTTPMIEGPFVVKEFNKEHGTNVKLIDHRVLDQITRSDVEDRIKEGLASITSTVIAFEEPGQTLGEKIYDGVYNGTLHRHGALLELETKGFRGECGIALAAIDITAADFKIDTDFNIFTISVPEERLIPIHVIPSEDGCYQLHSESGTPYGRIVEPSDEARELFVAKGRSFVGFYSIGSNNSVWVYFEPTRPSGVIVEVPKEDINRFERAFRKPIIDRLQAFLNLRDNEHNVSC